MRSTSRPGIRGIPRRSRRSSDSADGDGSRVGGYAGPWRKRSRRPSACSNGRGRLSSGCWRTSRGRPSARSSGPRSAPGAGSTPTSTTATASCRCGVHPSHGLPGSRRIRPRRGRRWILRGARRYVGRLLVTAAILASTPSGDLAGGASAVPGLLRVLAERAEAGQGAAQVADRAPGSANSPQDWMSARWMDGLTRRVDRPPGAALAGRRDSRALMTMSRRIRPRYRDRQKAASWPRTAGCSPRRGFPQLQRQRPADPGPTYPRPVDVSLPAPFVQPSRLRRLRR